MRGGYQMLDLSGVAFANGVAQTVENAYAKVNQMRKPVLIGGLHIGDATYASFYVLFVAGDNVETAALVIGKDTVTITVAQNDAVTVTVA